MLILALTAMIVAGNTVFASEFYMFKDSRGRTQIQDSIPSEYVKNGYRIVNANGVTIKVVPSEREQRKKMKANQLRETESTLAAQKKAEEDALNERLLYSFSSAEEIRQAGNKKILSVQTEIDATVGHVKAFEANLSKLEAQRAAGGKANDQSILELKKSIQQNYAFIDRKRKEQKRIRDEYLGLIKRYEMLTYQR